MSWFNNATGMWTGFALMGEPSFCGGTIEELIISKKDENILRKLAEEVLKFADDDREKGKRKLWYEHNDLQTKYPVIFCDPENGWNEIITEDMLLCKGSLARRWEYILRKKLFYAKDMADDTPVEKIFDINYIFSDSEWGVTEEYDYGGEGTTSGSYVWDSPIKKIEDIEKIKEPIIKIDYEATLRTISLALKTFENILNVRLVGIFWWTFGMTLDLVRLIGLENMMIQMTDNPNFIHEIMRRLTDLYSKKLDFLEKNALLTLNNEHTYIGTGALGYTNDLPKRVIDGSNVKIEDLWGNTESQETVGVSPEMFEEFVFRYQLEIQEKFGLNCYGCCEPVDKRWEVIKKVPNLRRVSVSHWADREVMAENLQDKYIYSWKPAPSYLAVKEIDQDFLRKYVRDTLDITKGCVLEIVTKDNHTIGKNPENIKNWIRIIREEVEKVYG
jgi:hypothetical protein